jgi:hypothetical protein
MAVFIHIVSPSTGDEVRPDFQVTVVYGDDAKRFTEGTIEYTVRYGETAYPSEPVDVSLPGQHTFEVLDVLIPEADGYTVEARLYVSSEEEADATSTIVDLDVSVDEEDNAPITLDMEADTNSIDLSGKILDTIDTRVVDEVLCLVFGHQGYEHGPLYLHAAGLASRGVDPEGEGVWDHSLPLPEFPGPIRAVALRSNGAVLASTTRHYGELEE